MATPTHVLTGSDLDQWRTVSTQLHWRRFATLLLIMWPMCQVKFMCHMISQKRPPIRTVFCFLWLVLEASASQVTSPPGTTTTEVKPGHVQVHFTARFLHLSIKPRLTPRRRHDWCVLRPKHRLHWGSRRIEKNRLHSLRDVQECINRNSIGISDTSRTIYLKYKTQTALGTMYRKKDRPSCPLEPLGGA